MTRVLIAEKQTLVRKMLRILLDADPDFEVVAEAAVGSEVIEKLQRVEINTLILNISLPGISGIDLIIRAKAICPKLDILVVCMHSDTHLVTQALKNGAGGYISTMHEPEEFLNALRKVTGGGRYIDPAIAESMLIESVSGTGDEPEHSRLSQRELEIFRLLVTGKAINEIADLLIISNKTVSSHKKKLMEKMHFSGMADLMRYAVQRSLFDDQGFTFDHDPQLLRSEAEFKLASLPPTKAATLAADELAHELHLHQIELEMQNEELRRTQAVLESSRDRYIDLYENAPVGYVTLSREGLVTEINVTGAMLLGEEHQKLVNRRFDKNIAPEDSERWHQHFMRALQHHEKQICELTFLRSDGTRIPARLDSQCKETGPSATVRIMLAVISENTNIPDTDQALLRVGSLPQHSSLS
jgi:PAS domain S-box-containing protein